MFKLISGPIPWKWIGVALAALAVVAAVIGSIMAYGNARYDAGVSDTDKAWQLAAEKLKQESAASGKKADAAADARADDYQKRLEEEKEKIDEAVQAGDSPFDVLFGMRD